MGESSKGLALRAGSSYVEKGASEFKVFLRCQLTWLGLMYETVFRHCWKAVLIRLCA